MLLSAFAVLVLILLSIPLKIVFSFSLEGEYCYLYIPFLFSRLNLLKKQRKKSNISIKTVLYALKKSKAERFMIDIAIGTGDAFEDVMIVGEIRKLFAELFSLFYRNNKISGLYVKIMPDFENKRIKTDADCIISIKAGNIIHAILKELTYKAKNHISKGK